MRKYYIVVSLVLAVLLAGAVPALAAANLPAALDYMKTQQNADGGFGSGTTPESSVTGTADAILAIVAAGGSPASFDKGGRTPLTYLAAQAPSVTTGGDLASLIMAAIAAGQNPRQFGGVDSVAKLEALERADGLIGGEKDTFFMHCLAVLALVSAGRPVPGASIGLIKTTQQDNGGWAWDGSGQTAADTNTTAVAAQALAAATGGGADNQVIAKAMTYFKGIQNEDGGWPYQNPSQYGTATDANSTAVTIQAIIAAGQDPAGDAWKTAGGKTPVAALEALQNPSGAFAWQSTVPGDNLLATFQAIPALAGKAFPLATMDVGAAAASAATPAPAPSATPGVTQIMPTTGGPVLPVGLALVLGGLVLVGAGYAVRRKRA